MSNSVSSTQKRWYHRLGPGLITACVVIGPGSILTSSKIGATYGYRMSWVVIVSVVFMLVFTTLGAKLGTVAAESNGTLIANRAGRWLAVLIGSGVFFISAAFQFGNNLGVLSAFREYEPYLPQIPFLGLDYILIAFNLLAILFLFVFHNIYRFVERLMMVLVGLMLMSFVINLFFAQPSISKLVKGFVPPRPSAMLEAGDVAWWTLILLAMVGTAIVAAAAFARSRSVERLMTVFVGLVLLLLAIDLFVAQPSIGDSAQGAFPSRTSTWLEAGDAAAANLTLLALVGTTFVITAAFFQSYLVRQKGWTKADLADGLRDVRVGVVIMALITITIMSTAAAQLRGQSLGNLSDIAEGLKPAFGTAGHALFCLGLFAAAYSSFLVNSMIGGFILADGLGLGNKPEDLGPRILTVAVLLTGMIVALLVSRAGFSPVPAIVAAQAVTVVAAPLVAGALWWLTNMSDVMGDERNGIFINTLAFIGFCMLLVMAWYTATYKVWPEVSKLIGAT